MNKKMKECMTPHAIMHSFIGLGIGLLLAHFVPTLANVWLGLVIVVVAVVLDFMRK